MIDEMDDADLDAPEGRGEPGEYIHYLRARSLLAERLGATAQEIAFWTWMGKESNGQTGRRDRRLS